MAKSPATVETYLADLRRIRASGGATAETSSYTPLEMLHERSKALQAVGGEVVVARAAAAEVEGLGAGGGDGGEEVA